MSESAIFKELAGWLWATLLPLIGIIYHKQEKRHDDHESRMDKIDKKVEEKADNSELSRQRNNIEKLFDGQRSIESTMSKGFEKVMDTMHNYHIDVVEKLNGKADRQR